ncbi:hypothetical protein [Absidia glauca]|uniref:Uncharacterized protein n=1 Tax=Absidia glauca TaxID=4829 RepID=A0A163KB44_ABSGL|nr:hypothetical protein [Absidia glauca]
MDYSFYALVAICIFLLILTFYLAVRRRRLARRRQVAQNRTYDPVANGAYQLNSGRGADTVVLSMDMPPHTQPIAQEGYRTPLTSDYNSTMTNRPPLPPGLTSSAAYKPEDNLPQLPPPSYQDYAKDVRL